MISITVDGIPRPGGSKRHIGGGRMIDAGKHTKEWRSQVATEARLTMLIDAHRKLDGALSVVCYFRVLRPKKHFDRKGNLKADAPKRPIVRPDATKYWRSTEDALTGIVWGDDSQVVDQLVSKVYATTAGADIYIEQCF